MRQRGQASVETIALMAAALALTAALTVGVIQFGPSLSSAVGRALSGSLSPGAPRAPGLDDLERALLAGATSPAAGGPTLLDVRTRLRARLARPAADAAFAALLQPIVADALATKGITSKPVAITLIDRATEAAWIRHRLLPSQLKRIGDTALGLAGIPGAAWSLGNDLGLTGDDTDDGIPAGYAAGDVVVQVQDGPYRTTVLRRRPGDGLAVIVAVPAHTASSTRPGAP